MKMDKSRDILKETGCLTGQQLQAYVQGKLTREQVHEVEMHLASCAFCSEAVDGLSAMKKPQELPGIIQQIRRRFRRKLHTHHSGGRKKLGRNYIWLAVIVIAIIAILLLAYYAIDMTMKGEHDHPQQPSQEHRDHSG